MPEFNKLNPDMANDKYNTELGIYQPNCGLENVKFAYGHDEYMYQFMVSCMNDFFFCNRSDVVSSAILVGQILYFGVTTLILLIFIIF